MVLSLLRKTSSVYSYVMVIFLNGSIHAGKSTVARILTDKLPHAALVEPDVFHEMIAWMPIDEAVPLCLQNTLAVIRTFIEKDIDVLVPYPLSQKNYVYMMNGLLSFGVRTYVFTLAPPREVALSTRGDRELTAWEKERIEYHYATGIANPTFGEVIDNSNQTPDETARIILEKVNSLT